MTTRRGPMMNGIDRPIVEQFVNEPQRRQAVQLGIWLFLATEIMMFGTLVFVATYYRTLHGAAISEAVAHLHYLLAATNSALLLGSSLAISLALVAANRGREHVAIRCILIAAALATGFICLKGYEYASEYQEHLLPFQSDNALAEGPARLYMGIYMVATSLHGIHVLVAIVLALTLSLRIHIGRLKLPQRVLVIEAFALYWHVVDVIWILLFPTLYLLGRPL